MIIGITGKLIAAQLNFKDPEKFALMTGNIYWTYNLYIEGHTK